MKSTLWSAFKFVVLVGLVVGTVGWYQQRNVVSGPAPTVNWVDLNGQKVDLPALTQQEPVLIYFWATWCGYCRAVSPTISDLAKENQVVSVALQSGSDKDIAEYLQQHQLSFRTVNDSVGQFSAEWGVRVTPTIVIINSDGEVSWVTSGITSKWGLLARLWLAR